jgi:hypothetical protein
VRRAGPGKKAVRIPALRTVNVRSDNAFPVPSAAELRNGIQRLRAVQPAVRVKKARRSGGRRAPPAPGRLPGTCARGGMCRTGNENPFVFLSGHSLSRRPRASQEISGKSRGG